MIWQTLQPHVPFFLKSWKGLLIFLIGLSLALGIGQFNPNLPSVQGQTIRVETAAEMVYQKLPYLPKDNQYIRQETKQVDPDFTLINRLIRYHEDLKKRSTIFRLDWQLTLADYLGVNETIKEDRYPGNSTLTANPMQSDIQAIRQLNRRQRQELIDVLVSIYTPQPKPAENSSSQTESNPTGSPRKPSSGPTLSKPGDAQLLGP
ncbi:hypothetical protein [Aphanothece sacrum]|uniref:Uncharacterized protein n=1 Tax=Aphanothece sacrum FPU1 TaxID=1920663 RepID=A0A401IN41_APHSA|nr:hypothetical protein [Aphanothece sacrum]GBF82663.1 hypothetical protein AsFPU1_4096 [Aphanothece sacrum FPU1]GBF84545.1 hypothetical protein AsFPU3_1595 [Aphanothece sacrum FPU3]